MEEVQLKLESANSPAKSPIEAKPATNQAQIPHWLTVILSLLAFTVSVLSYVESHRSRLLNEAINRPLVRVTTVEAGLPVADRTEINGPRMPNYYALAIKNSGKAFANNVRVTYKAQLEDVRCCTGFLRFSDRDGETKTTIAIGDLAPEDQYDASLWAYILKDNPTIQLGNHRVNMVSLYIVGEVRYSSSITGAEYREPFCFTEYGTEGEFRRCSSKEPVYK